MAGYTRQSSADITPGATVRAAPINAELNQVLDAFSNTLGHKHDGSTAEGPVIGLIGDAGETAPNNKVVIDTTNNEIEFYVQVSNAPVEQVIIKDGVIEPTTDDDVDLGSTSKQFKDLHLDGTANIDSLVADTVDINAGSIDGTDIGGTTRATADFTNLSANGTVNFTGATLSNLGSVTTADINGGSIDGVTIGTNSAVTDLRVDNLKLDANTISATNTNGSITLTPAGTGSVVIGAVDINGGAIDGTAIGASSASTGAFTTLTTSGQATLATADINGGTADNVVIGGTTRAAGNFTTVNANAGITGDLTGNVTGNITGNIVGNITGNITGDVTGNVTASSGTTTLNNLTVNGTTNFTSTTLTNVTDPVNAQDAATKNYVDTELASLVDSAPGALNTLNELAAAIGDDANFSTTITNSIAAKLPLAGGTMTGAIAMGSSKITGLGTPTAGTDAATKAYADTKLPLAGGTMTGNITMGSNSITGLPTPSAASDAATKDYVDTTNASNTAAATSAANAATSETNAATSETNAATSAANALTSANNAAASYDLFDDRFLGAKASAPAVDNDGDALVIGSLYFDTTTDTMKVYGSGGWVAAGSTVNGTSQRKTYAVGTNEGTYTGSTTVFPISYDAGFIDVYLNGIKLDPDNDFTATNGTSVTLSSAAASGDIVDMVAYGTFQLANFSVGDANNVDLAGQLTGHVLTYNGSNYVPSDQGRTIHLGGDGSNDGVSVSDGAISMRTGTGNPAYIDMYCEVSNAHKVTIKAPAHATYSGNVNFTLPPNNGSSGQFLQTDGSGNLSYATVAQPSNATTSTAGLMSAADKTKMDGIEASADVTDTANVTSAGALMTTGGTMSGNLTFGDNNKAIFGAGPDLEVYSDGTYSRIMETGGQFLVIDTNGSKISLTSDNSKNMGEFIKDGAVQLFHNGTTRFSTTSVGIAADQLFGIGDTDTGIALGANGADVMQFYAGNTERLRVNSSGIDVTGSVTVTANNPNIRFDDSDTSNNGEITLDNTSLRIEVDEDNAVANSFLAFRVDGTELARIEANGLLIQDGKHIVQEDDNSWTGDTAGKWQYHGANHYFVGSGFYYRTQSGINRFYVDGNGNGHFDGNVTAYSNSVSDPRLKDDIAPVTDALSKVERLTGYTFTMKKDGKASAGVLSTEVSDVLPSAVQQTTMPLMTDSVTEEPNETLYDTVEYDQLHALLIEAVKELSARVKELENDAAK